MARASDAAGGRDVGALVHGWWRRASWLDRLRLRRAQAIGSVIAVECDEPLACGTLLALTTARTADELWARVVEVMPRGDGLFSMQLALLSEPPATRDVRAAEARDLGSSTRALDPVEAPVRAHGRADSRARIAAPCALDGVALSPRCAALSLTAARTLG